MSNKFNSLSELVKSVVLEATKGISDERLISCKAPTGLNETTNADGGYLVTSEIGSTLLENIQQNAVIFPKTTRLQTSSYGAKVPFVDESTRKTNDSGCLNAFWVGEAEQKTSDYPAFGQLDLKLHKLVVMMPVTDELLQDSVLLQGWIDQFVAKKIAWEIDRAILLGNGGTSMHGIMGPSSNGTIGVDVSTVNEATILNMISALAPAAQKNAEFYVSKENFNTLMGLTWDNNDFIHEAGEHYIYGFKCNVMEQMVAPYDIMLGDVSQYCTLTKGDIVKGLNISLRYDYDETMLRWVIRINGKSFGNTYILEDASVVGTFVVPQDTPAEDSSSSSSSSSEDDVSNSSNSSSSYSSSSSSSSSSKSVSSGSSASSASSASSDSSSMSSGYLGNCEEFYTASGFATSSANGQYKATGAIVDSKPVYFNGTNYIFHDNTYDVWAISGTAGDPPNQWISSGDVSTTCPNGTYVGEAGIVA